VLCSRSGPPVSRTETIVLYKYGDVTVSTGGECGRLRVELLGMLVNPTEKCANANDYAYAMAA